MGQPARHVILCNGAPKSLVPKRRGDVSPLVLDHSRPGRVRLKLPQFVREVGSIPRRALDFLEIASHVFAADRLIDRGPRDQLLYNSWGRDFAFGLRVRDVEFWNREDVRAALSSLLLHLTGDCGYQFYFAGGHSTPPAHLFDDQSFVIEPDRPHSVALFSGGLDSLSGIYHKLKHSDDVVCLVSHRSGSPSTARTQSRLAHALHKEFPTRVKHFSFDTGLSSARAVTETQRTRTFLYGAVAYALSSGLSQQFATFFENGVTSINLARRQDLLNARASRTTHPKTLYMLASLLSLMGESDFRIYNPFRWLTKTEVLRHLAASNGAHLISSSVSCSRTALAAGLGTHCGTCLQCIDRRFAVAAAGLSEFDPVGLYSTDFINEDLESLEARTALLDYVRLGIACNVGSEDAILNSHFTELADLPTPADSENDVIRVACSLLKRFGAQTINGLEVFNQSASLAESPRPYSLHGMISAREYLRPQADRLLDKVATLLRSSLPKMFSKHRPINENDLNDKIQGLLDSQTSEFMREFPAVSFACSRVIPDHLSPGSKLILESKYSRKHSALGKLSDEIAADLVKYPDDHIVAFLIYDPDRSIHDDLDFAESFQKFRACRIVIVR